MTLQRVADGPGAGVQGVTGQGLTDCGAVDGAGFHDDVHGVHATVRDKAALVVGEGFHLFDGGVDVDGSLFGGDGRRGGHVAGEVVGPVGLLFAVAVIGVEERLTIETHGGFGDVDQSGQNFFVPQRPGGHKVIQPQLGFVGFVVVEQVQRHVAGQLELFVEDGKIKRVGGVQFALADPFAHAGAAAQPGNVFGLTGSHGGLGHHGKLNQLAGWKVFEFGGQVAGDSCLVDSGHGVDP